MSWGLSRDRHLIVCEQTVYHTPCMPFYFWMRSEQTFFEEDKRHF